MFIYTAETILTAIILGGLGLFFIGLYLFGKALKLIHFLKGK